MQLNHQLSKLAIGTKNITFLVGTKLVLSLNSMYKSSGIILLERSQKLYFAGVVLGEREAGGGLLAVPH